MAAPEGKGETRRGARLADVDCDEGLGEGAEAVGLDDGGERAVLHVLHDDVEVALGLGALGGGGEAGVEAEGDGLGGERTLRLRIRWWRAERRGGGGAAARARLAGAEVLDDVAVVEGAEEVDLGGDVLEVLLRAAAGPARARGTHGKQRCQQSCGRGRRDEAGATAAARVAPRARAAGEED